MLRIGAGAMRHQKRSHGAVFKIGEMETRHRTGQTEIGDPGNIPAPQDIARAFNLTLRHVKDAAITLSPA